MTSSPGGNDEIDGAPDRRPGAPPGSEVSERWAAWRGQVDLDEYDRRWEHLAAAGEVVHGEADLIESLCGGRERTVLDAGCGTGRVTIELARRGFEVVGVDLDADMVAAARRKAPELTWLVADLATMHLDRRFMLVAMAGNVLNFARPSDHGLIVRTLVGHLEPGGLLVTGFSLERGGLSVDGYDALCETSGLERVDRWSTWDRQPFTASNDYHVTLHRRPEA
jgi:SAM-dependent methyltransferase